MTSTQVSACVVKFGYLQSCSDLPIWSRMQSVRTIFSSGRTRERPDSSGFLSCRKFGQVRAGTPRCSEVDSSPQRSSQSSRYLRSRSTTQGPGQFPPRLLLVQVYGQSALSGERTLGRGGRRFGRVQMKPFRLFFVLRLGDRLVFASFCVLQYLRQNCGASFFALSTRGTFRLVAYFRY